MLLALALILFIFWALGLLGNIGGSLIHLLLVVILIVIVVQLISGRRVG